jgi:hypothetical protein
MYSSEIYPFEMSITLIVQLLAILSASASAGMRIGLPLLVIGLLNAEYLWSEVPFLSAIHPQVLIAILTSWSLFELFGSKRLLGQRILQQVQLLFSPLVGGILAVTVAKLLQVEFQPIWLIGLTGGLLALVIKLVQVGWFFRLRGIPLGVVFLEDALCVFLVFFAFNAPEEGGLIAMLLLWIAIRSSTEWRQWYSQNNKNNQSKQVSPRI